MVYARQSRWPEALEALAQAGKLDPGYAMMYYYRGGVHASTGNIAEAVADYQHALTLDPNNQPARQALAYVMQQSGR
jgi:tetratricopeptide (TPR) repeat protein